jgi:hypothetical protein
MPGEILAADLLTKALDRVRFNKLLKLMLNPNAEHVNHDDKTTKAYSSNNMGDGPTDTSRMDRGSSTRQEAVMVILPLHRQQNPIPFTTPLETRKAPRDKGLQNVNKYNVMEARILAVCKAKETDLKITTALKLTSTTYLVRVCNEHDELVQISDDKNVPSSGTCKGCCVDAIHEEVGIGQTRGCNCDHPAATTDETSNPPRPPNQLSKEG